ncbi:hypothetical protein EJB05_07377, partial [Eragrostis curvula]
MGEEEEQTTEAMGLGKINWAEIDWEEPVEGYEDQSSMEVETTTGSESRGMGCVLDYLRVNPIGVTINPASLCPPSLAGGDTRISWVLLDLVAYIADRGNATTAKAFTRARHEIQATLCTARPPRVSHLCVYRPKLTPADFGTEPRMLASSDDLILFQAAICNSSVCFEQAMQDYFVYQAAPPMHDGEGGPSLTLLPHPGPSRSFSVWQVGILRGRAGGFLQRHGQNHYVIAALCRSAARTRHDLPKVGEPSFYDLHRFDSISGEWTTDELQLGPVELSQGKTYFCFCVDKVITLEDGFMGWVDPSQGILLCNVLVKDPELCYIAFPQRDNMQLTCTETDRDIAFIQGKIRLVEHNTHVRPGSFHNGTYISENWKATVCSWKTNSDSWEGEWVKGHTCDATRISGSLSKLLGYSDNATSLPALQRLHTGHPTFSLDDADVVYFLAKVDHKDEKAFVLSVNMRNGTLQGADCFDAERMVGISFSYTQSRVSGYLQVSQVGPLGVRICPNYNLPDIDAYNTILQLLLTICYIHKNLGP